MEVSIEQIGELESKMTLAVPAVEVQTAISKRLQETAKKVSLKGFRPGRAPMNEVKRRFGTEINQEVVHETMVNHFFKVVKEKSLRPAHHPAFHRKSESLEEDLVFEAVYETFPEVNLADLSTIKLVKKVAEVSDDAVADEIDRIKKSRRVFVEAESNRVAELGDKVHIVWQEKAGADQAEGVDNGNERTLDVLLDEASFPEAIVKGLVGSKVGTEHQIKLGAEEQSKEEEKADQKKDVLECKVVKIEAARLPELNEEFFQTLGGFNPTLEGFQQYVRSAMEDRLKETQLRDLKAQIFRQLAELHQNLPIPKALVKEELDRLTSSQSAPQESDEEQRTKAEESVRLQLILQHLIQEYKLTASKEAVMARVNKMAEPYPEPHVFVKWYYKDENRIRSVQNRILEDGLVDELLTVSQLEEQRLSYKEAVEQSAKA